MHGLNRVEKEYDKIHYQTSLQRKKDGILGSNSNNRNGLLNSLWSDPGKLINVLRYFLDKLNFFFSETTYIMGDV